MYATPRTLALCCLYRHNFFRFLSSRNRVIEPKFNVIIPPRVLFPNCQSLPPHNARRDAKPRGKAYWTNREARLPRRGEGAMGRARINPWRERGKFAYQPRSLPSIIAHHVSRRSPAGGEDGTTPCNKNPLGYMWNQKASHSKPAPKAFEIVLAVEIRGHGGVGEGGGGSGGLHHGAEGGVGELAAVGGAENPAVGGEAGGGLFH